MITHQKPLKNQYDIENGQFLRTGLYRFTARFTARGQGIALCDLLRRIYPCRMRTPSVAQQFESMAAALVSSGLSYRQIGREARLSPSTVFRAAVGDCRQPSAETFVKLEIVWRKRGCPERLK